MKFIRLGVFPLLLLAIFFVPQAQLQSLQTEPVLNRYLVPWADADKMPQISDHFEVHHKAHLGYEVIVPEIKAEEFHHLSPNGVLLERDIDARTRDVSREALLGYHNFASVETHLKQIEKDNFDIARVETYGSSKEGRPLFALRLEGRALAMKKEILLTSATHGDELITVEVVFDLVDRIVKGYGNDARMTALLDNFVIYYIPVVNPDGYVRRTRYSNGVDPNREYPWPDMPERNPNPCIKALMDFTQQHDFVASLDYHSALGTYMYPWSYKESSVHAEDAAKFREVSRKMAAKNGYKFGQIPHLLYIAKGASADYYYWKKKTFAMAVEISGSNNPPASQISHYADENAEPLWIFLESMI